MFSSPHAVFAIKTLSAYRRKILKQAKMLSPQVSPFSPSSFLGNSTFAKFELCDKGELFWGNREWSNPAPETTRNRAGSMTYLIETKLLRISDDEPPPLRIVFSFVSKNICFLTTPPLLRNKLVVDLFPFFAVIFQSRCLIDLRGDRRRIFPNKQLCRLRFLLPVRRG